MLKISWECRTKLNRGHLVFTTADRWPSKWVRYQKQYHFLLIILLILLQITILSFLKYKSTNPLILYLNTNRLELHQVCCLAKEILLDVRIFCGSLSTPWKLKILAIEGRWNSYSSPLDAISWGENVVDGWLIWVILVTAFIYLLTVFWGFVFTFSYMYLPMQFPSH